MENFIVSARKYRPITFDSVVGQSHITSTLKNAIHNNQLAQAFLFCGPRGVGKTTCARILAKTINCENIASNTEACGECQSCISFQNGNSFSIHELDAASNNSVDDIRSLIEQVRIPPQVGKYKIYIIDEVHMLSQQAFNAFLKTLEEPPSYAIFILATTEKHKILPTILSRCQIFDFNRIRVEDMASHLSSIAQKEEIQYDEDGLHIIAQKADGGLRDALSMFDQIVSFSNKHITYQAVIDNLNILDYDYYFKVVDAIDTQNPSEALLIFDHILNHGFDGGHFINGLSAHFRNLLVGKEKSTIKLLEVSESIKQKYLEQAQRIQASVLLSALNIANQCEINYRTSKNQRLQVELALLKMCHINSVIQLQKLNSELSSTQEDQKKKRPEINNHSAAPQDNTKTAPIPTPLAKSPTTAMVKEDPAVAPTVATSTVKSEKKGWGQMKASSLAIPNLQTILDDKQVDESEENALVEGDEFAEVSFDEFYMKWKEFAQKAKSESKITLYTIMTANVPRLVGNRIEVDVENTLQQDELKIWKIDILNFLRQVLKNYSLDLDHVLVEQAIVRKAYTSQEKYQAMVEKNPALETLRRKFNLGLS